MIYITGDTHGEQSRFYLLDATLKGEDVLIIAGDAGLLFKNDSRENIFLNDLEKKDYTIVVIPGNHENYAAIATYPVVDYNGAKAYQIRKNVFYICRGEIMTLTDGDISGSRSFFCMGGGYSVDRYMRVKNVSYWEEEMPTDEEFQYATKNLKDFLDKGGKIDYVVSHTAPLSGLAMLGKHHGAEEYPLNNYLEYVRETIPQDTFKMWYYGHLHMEREMPHIKQTVLWFEVKEIK